MGDKTQIEWTDATWNPVTGCTKVSAGCDNCYAEKVANRFAGTKAYPDGFKVTLRPDRLDQPLRWKRPRSIFVNSMSDLFHSDVPDEFIARVFAIMAIAQQHTYQVLTKRPGRMRSLLGSGDFWRMVGYICDDAGNPDAGPDQLNPAPNVWLGVSVEDQKWADIRIPLLLDTPAAVRFLSCEPLLGPVRLDMIDWSPSRYGIDGAINSLTGSWWPAVGDPIEEARLHEEGHPKIDWVIVGGESGPHARPMHPEWARSLRDQCVVGAVPFLFKQWGEWRWAQEADDHDYEVAHGDRFAQPWLSLDIDGTLHDGAPTDTSATVQKVGKKAAGRDLDGCTWDEYPEVTR